jgi:hypothetical protein
MLETRSLFTAQHLKVRVAGFDLPTRSALLCAFSLLSGCWSNPACVFIVF